MRNKLATYALAAAVGLTGIAGAALVAPAVSLAAPGDSTRLDKRVSWTEQALSGLVTDGTLTQAQADEVARALADSRPGRGARHLRGNGHPGSHLHLQAAAETLGMTREELRSAAKAGSTLAELAEQEGVSQDVLLDALVAAEKRRLAQAVRAGRLTPEQARQRSEGAEARIRERLDDPIARHGARRVHRD